MNQNEHDSASPTSAHHNRARRWHRKQAHAAARRTGPGARRARRRARVVVGVVTGTVCALVASSVAVGIVSQQSTEPSIPGLRTYDGLTRNHVTGSVDYLQRPAVGGDHSPVWLNCGIYAQPVPNENTVHSLEHGAIWIAYDPDAVNDAQLRALQMNTPGTYAILSPIYGLDHPIMVSAWGAQLTVKTPDDPRLKQFITKYWQSSSAPEPGAPCSGGLDGPGKQ